MKQTHLVVLSLLAGLAVAAALVVAKPKPKRKQKPPAVAKQLDPTFEKGFQVGFVMAKTGAHKPSAEDVDAMARKAALKDNGQGGYTLQWKNGFWMGWNQGD